GPDRTLRFFTTSPDVVESSVKFDTDRTLHVATVFSSRGRLAKLYVDGKLVGGSSNSERWVSPRTTIPLCIAADQDGGNRFIGSITRLAVYNRTLSADEVEQRFKNLAMDRGLVGEWILTADGGDTIKPAAGDFPLVDPVEITSEVKGPKGGL